MCYWLILEGLPHKIGKNLPIPVVRFCPLWACYHFPNVEWSVPVSWRKQIPLYSPFPSPPFPYSLTYVFSFYPFPSLWLWLHAVGERLSSPSGSRQSPPPAPQNALWCIVVAIVTELYNCTTHDYGITSMK